MLDTDLFRFSLTDELTMLARLFVAAVAGGLVGYERGTTGHHAGIRTLSLVAVGSALFALVSMAGFEGGDPARIAAQVATGVGFIGAGTIIVRGRDVQGLTTAATVWLAAALGLAAGTGMYVLALGGAALAIAILTLLPRQHLPEDRVESHEDNR